MRKYLLGLYEKSMPDILSIPEKLCALKKAGFDHLELSVDETDEKLLRLDWSYRDVLNIRHAQEETEVPIRSLCLSGHRKYPLGHPDDQVRKRGMDIMYKAIRLAGLLGIRLIQLAGYDVYYEHSNKQTQAYFAENIHLAALTAAREGVVLAFETMETSFMDTVSKAMSWIKTVQSPYLQIYPDIGNLTNAAVLYNQSLAEDFRTGIGHLAALHLKETLPGRYREVPYGTGHVDFRQVVDEAMSLGIRLFVAEFWHMGETNWQEILKKNNCFLRSFFETTTP